MPWVWSIHPDISELALLSVPYVVLLHSVDEHPVPGLPWQVFLGESDTCPLSDGWLWQSDGSFSSFSCVVFCTLYTKFSRIKPQSWNPPSVSAGVDFFFFISQMKNASDVGRGHRGWLDHEVHHPLPWQDNQSCHEVVLVQGERSRTWEERCPDCIWRIKLLLDTLHDD